MKATILLTLVTLAALVFTATELYAQEAADDERAKGAEVAKKLQNPVAKLMSVPIQSNWDFGIGPKHAMSYAANIQPVIPFSLNEDWNLITRSIVPIIYAESPVKDGDDKAGLADILQSFFFTPTKPVGGWVVGAGPVFLWPTAIDSALGAGRWGAGPTAVVLTQQCGLTYGMLANHVWSYAGWGDQDVSATLLQPFVSYRPRPLTTVSLSTESIYEWEQHQWIVPLNLTVKQLLKVRNQVMSLEVGGRYYPEKPDGGPDWGLRFGVTFVFPK